MNRFEFFKPIRPLVQTQGWGIYRPDVYSQFGFSRHNGNDYAVYNGQRILAPFDGKVVRVGNQPNGGGIFIGVLSKNKYWFDQGPDAYVLADFLHCKEIILKEGDTFRVGDLLAYGDNTGFSTGPHCHIQLRKVDENLNILEPNDANNSFDATPYLSFWYAEQFRAFQDTLDEIKAGFSNLLKGRNNNN